LVFGFGFWLEVWGVGCGVRGVGWELRVWGLGFEA
jgi:hypothetical protein